MKRVQLTVELQGEELRAYLEVRKQKEQEVHKQWDENEERFAKAWGVNETIQRPLPAMSRYYRDKYNENLKGD